MPEQDPLALRHGGLIAHAWTAVDSARSAVRSGQPSHGYLHRLRQIRRRVVGAHQAELLRAELATGQIDNWFADIERTLKKAEGYLQNCVVYERDTTPVETMHPPTRRRLVGFDTHFSQCQRIT